MYFVIPVVYLLLTIQLYMTALRINNENDLALLYDWFCANKLSLNVLKTNFVVFSHKQRAVSQELQELQLGNETIIRAQHVTFLGIHIDDELEWGEHINHIAKKISSGCYAINANKRYLSTSNLITLYYSLVHSHLSYGNMLWMSAYQYRLRRLEVLQNKAVRNIINAPYNASAAPIYKQLNIPRLVNINRIQLGKFVFKFTNNLLPVPLLSIFSLNYNIHQHNTRHSRDPHIEPARTKRLQRYFIHTAPKLWLELPNIVKTAKSINSFNRRVKKHYMSLS